MKNPPRILIVEDESIVAFNLQQRLAHLGYDVPHVAASGRQSLEMATQSQPDLVLMDIHIEGDMDGIETASRLGEDNPVPVIYLTAYAEDATLARARETQPYGFLIKPFSERELHATIQMALERHKVELALKHSESRLRTLNESLETRIAERTHELHESLRELESYSYSVAHDLRAPLRAIAGLSDILVEDHKSGLNEEGSELLTRIADKTKEMGELIDALLNLSRISKSMPMMMEVDLSDLATEIMAQQRATAPARVADIQIAPGMTALCDLVLVRSVFDNLLRNAWKFSARNAITRIDVGHHEAQGEHVFFVRDNGCGFDMAHAHQLFNPFKRLHSQHEFKGTGVGLSIVQRIVARHGGRVWVQAEKDKGATFFFTLAAPLDNRG